MAADPRYSLNAICPYFTMFPLEFPLRILKRHPSARTVADPFCGRGTTLFAARLKGLRAYGIDCSPVAVAISEAKLARINLRQCLSLARRIIAHSKTVDVPTGEFWQRAYHASALRDLCALRAGLLKRDSSSDKVVLLRAAVLGCLHGPLSSTNSYLSNQMPRTFAPKPDYAVRFWKSRSMAPPKIDVVKAIERKLKRIEEEDRTARARCRGAVYRGDASDRDSYRAIRTKLSLAITSPAYYGMRTYVPDQWLRNWFLGGPADVDYSAAGSLPMTNPSEYAEALGEVWSNLARRADNEFHLYVRFGGIPSRAVDPKRLLLNSLEDSDHRWRIVSLRTAKTAEAGKRQARHMRAHTVAAIEYDLHALLLD